MSQKLQMALAEVTQLYLRAAFSPRPPGETETQTAQRLWQHAWPEWVRLLIANRLSRIANRLSRIADR